MLCGVYMLLRRPLKNFSARPDFLRLRNSKVCDAFILSPTLSLLTVSAPISTCATALCFARQINCFSHWATPSLPDVEMAYLISLFTATPLRYRPCPQEPRAFLRSTV